LAYKITIGLMLGLVLLIVGSLLVYLVRMMRREERDLRDLEERRRREAAAQVK
jgi:hypothetical protein